MTSDVVRSCELCGGGASILYRGNTEAREFFKVGDYRIAEGGRDEKLDVYQCGECGLGFSPYNITERELGQFYAIQPRDEGYLSQEAGRRKSFGKILNKIEEMKPSKGKIFDFGSGPGFFLDEARKRGWQVCGSEISLWGRDFAKKELGIELYPVQGLERFPDGFFDVITIFDVIEHTIDPAGLLKLVRAKLRPGGLLVMTTPRFESITRKILGQEWYFMFPVHLWYFTKKSIDKLLSDAELNAVKYGFHVFNFSAGYMLERTASLVGIKKEFRNGIFGKIMIPFCLGEEWEIYAENSPASSAPYV